MWAQCIAKSAAPSITICSPAAGGSFSSPVSISAVAASSTAVKFMQVYVDNQLKYQVNNSNLVNTQLSLSAGSHNLVVQFYNGTYTKKGETISITSSTPPPSPPPSPAPPPTSAPCTLNTTNNTLTICTPTAGSTTTSPVHVSAGVTSSASVKFMQVYVDNTLAYSASNTSSIDTQIQMAAGSRYVVVQAYNGAYIKTPVRFTVGTSTSPPPPPPPPPSTQLPCTLSSTNNTLTICTPTAGSTNTSPVRVSAGVTSSAIVKFMQVYVDNQLAYQASSTSTIDTQLPMSIGKHYVVVQAYNGAYIKTPVTITVATSAPPPPPSSGPPPPAIGIFTYKFDNARSGLNSQETVLTPSAVSGGTFGVKGNWALDGNVFTQPLLAPGVSIGSNVYNVVCVGTENGSVYALNADAPGSAPLWKRSFIDPSTGINPASGNFGGRTGIGPIVSITGTPVIDPGRNAMYVSVMTNESGKDVQRLHEIDIRDGTDMVAPVVIAPKVPGTGDGNDGNGNVPFNPPTENQRAALLLANNVVWVAFAGFSDTSPYHGWLAAFDAGTLSFIDAFNSSPDTGGGGIWMGGSGPAADSSGNVYIATANGGYSGESPSNSVLKFALVSGKITLVDYFSPFNTVCLSSMDLDLGSTGPLLLPDGAGGGNYVVAGSKEGRVYLLNRDDLGKFNANNDSQIPQSILINSAACGDSSFDASSSMRMYGSAAWWNSNVYLGSVFGPLRAYSLASGQLTQSSVSTNTFAGSGQSGRGPMPVVSSNGSSGAIVWTARRELDGTARLWAYDATDLSKTLYSATYGSGIVFAVPTVINGKVYVAGGNTIYVLAP